MIRPGECDNRSGYSTENRLKRPWLEPAKLSSVVTEIGQVQSNRGFAVDSSSEAEKRMGSEPVS